MDIQHTLASIGIVPVVTIDHIEDAIAIATSLYEGGIPCAEITFRSPHAVEAISRITQALPTMIVGAGTIHSCKQAQDAIDAGAKFLVTPGFHHEVVAYAIAQNIPIFPGVSSASEIETAMSYGLTTLKFFPAESSGGAQKLKDLIAPYPTITFMPTGGINTKNMHTYLSLSNVFAIGGSFMLPKHLIQDKNWHAVKQSVQLSIRDLLQYELQHIGMHTKDTEEAQQIAQLLCHLFNFSLYKKPHSYFAGKDFEISHKESEGIHGHIGIYTPYPERAIYQLKRKGIEIKKDTITRNKTTHAINFVYLDMQINGFALHLINPDIQMT